MTGRALLALLLTVAFYALALGAVFVLLWLPYAEWTYAGRLHIQLALVCVVGAALLLFSVVPRRARFVRPGPRITREAQPVVWSWIDDVARRTGQPRPSEAYWIPGVNAFVTSTGGFLGFGGRRVLGLGYPLVCALDEKAVKGVLAHEFGHFHGGDVRLGPLVYGTRGAILRTVGSLGAAGERSVFFYILRLPFLGYAKLFLRVTHAVSRRQEFAADALAAQVVGPAAMGRALSALPRLDTGWDLYIHGEVAPVMSADRRPPLAEGWRAYLEAPEARSALDALEARTRGDADPYDTHPPVPDRLRALGVDPARAVATDAPPAAAAVAGRDELESALLCTMTGSATAAGLKPVAWDRVFPDVFEPQWREALAKHKAALLGVRADALPSRPEALTELGRRMDPVDRGNAAACNRLAVNVVAVALASALLRRGWTVDCRPGAPLRLKSGGQSVDPWQVVRDASLDQKKAEAWSARASALGLAGLDLGAEAGAAAESARKA